MGVPSFKLASAKQSERTKNDTIKFNKLNLSALIGLTLTLVILKIGECSAENEQYWYYKELERLKQQTKTTNYNWADPQRGSHHNFDRPHNYPRYPHENFELQNYGVVHQEQRQLQHLNSNSNIHNNNNQDLQHLLLHKSILKIENTKYTQWTENETYYSTTAYNALGMAPLYNITNTVIDFFVDADEPIPDGYVIFQDKQVVLGPKIREQDFADLLKKYWAILLVAFVVLLIAALMPIIGLCFCCCRCAGRSQPFDKKHDTCRRFFLGFFLIIVASSMVFGVIVAFVTNYTLQNGIENVTMSARTGVDDTRVYLKSTSSHIRHILVENYGELNQNLRKTLDDTAGTVVKQLEDTSKAVKLKQLNTFVEKLPQIQTDLERMKTLTSVMRTNASQLNDGLRNVKKNLLENLRNCETRECKEVEKEYEIGRLDQNDIEYDQLPDVSTIIDDVKRLLDSSLHDNVQKGQQALEDIEKDVAVTINENVAEIKKSINEVGRAIRGKSDELSGRVEQIADVAGNNSYKYFKVADEYINKYSIYRYYAGLGISSVLLIVLVFVTFGLLCGICGKRPDGYGDDCCNKGAGARFLMCGVAVIFLTISVLLVVSLALFIAGIVLRRGGCDPLNNPESDQIIISYVDNLIDLNTIFYPQSQGKAKSRNGAKTPQQEVKQNPREPFRISEVVGACHRNESIYNVLKLENIFNISEVLNYPNEFGIYTKLNNLRKELKIDVEFQILDEQTRREIQGLSKSELNRFDSDKFTDNLATEITKYNLENLATTLRNTATKIAANGPMRDIKTSLSNQAMFLDSIQKNLVEPMIKGTEELVKLSTSLSRDLKFGESSFENAIKNFLKEIDEAESYIRVNGTEFVQSEAKVLLDGFISDITEYLQLVVNQTENDVGKCGPISNVYNSLIVATCNRVVDPFNGFWAGVVWCLLLFFPTIILSAKLSTLYQKSDPYPGQLVEAEYLYDAYSEREHIPLANVPKNKRRRKNDRRHDARDRRGDYYEESSPTTAATNAPRDARYNDMAPKNWDEAPPRYQNPPIAPTLSELERPPPYYNYNS